MAISTRAELFTAVDSFTNRADTAYTDMRDNFVQLAEAELFDDLMPRPFESEESLSFTQDQNYVALPSGFISPIALWLVVDSERVPLVKTLPELLPYYSGSGQPQFWAIDGANIRFDVPAYEAYSGKFRMLKSSAITASNTTNGLLTARPDIYVAGYLIQFAMWDRDEAMEAKFRNTLRLAKASYKAKENRSRDVPLRTDIPMRVRSNIFTGD